MGSTGVSTKLSTSAEDLVTYANFDSGIMNIPFVLGWPGALLYVSGLTWLLLNAWRGTGSSHDLLAAASRGIAAAVLAQLLFANTLVSVSGMVFWTFLGLSLAARLHHASAADVAVEPRVHAGVESVGSLQGYGR